MWGDDHFPDGKAMANTWQGEFPWQNLQLDRYEGTPPVAAFPPNGYGLVDMAGNVWERTSDLFAPAHGETEHACCAPQPTRYGGAPELRPRDDPPSGNEGRIHLCAPNYCLR